MHVCTHVCHREQSQTLYILEKRHLICSKCHGKDKSLTMTFQNHLCCQRSTTTSMPTVLQLSCFFHACLNILFLQRKQNTLKLRIARSGPPCDHRSLDTPILVSFNPFSFPLYCLLPSKVASWTQSFETSSLSSQVSQDIGSIRLSNY